MQKKITVLIATGLLAAAGYTAIPETVEYNNIPFDNQLKTELTERMWNGKRVPLEGSLIRQESWLLPDKLVDARPTRFALSVSSGWKSYLSSAGGWKEINTEFIPTATGFEMKEAPFEVYLPKFSNGIAIFRNNSRWDAYMRNEVTDPPVDMTLKALSVNSVQGTAKRGELITRWGKMNVPYVEYLNVLPDTDLIYYVHMGSKPRLEKLIRRNVRTGMQMAFEFSVPGSQLTRQGVFTGEAFTIMAGPRDFGFGPPKIWDSNMTRIKTELQQKQEFIEYEIRTLANGNHVLVKRLPAVGPDWQLPIWSDVVISKKSDADPETNTFDGFTKRNLQSAVWTDERNATIALGSAPTTDAGTTLWPVADDSGAALDIERVIMLFDTSAIPDGATINDSASTSLNAWTESTKADNSSDDLDSINIVQSFPTFDAGYFGKGEDHNNFCDATDCVVSSGAKVASSSVKKMADLLVDSGYNFKLDATGRGWIADTNDLKPSGTATTGITRLGMMVGNDVYDQDFSAATRNVYIDWHSADATLDPILDVDYTEAVATPADTTQVIIISRMDYLKNLIINTALAFIQ